MSAPTPPITTNNDHGGSRPSAFRRFSTLSTRLPGGNIPDTFRNNFIATLGEFVGTFLFLFFSFAGTQISNEPPPTPGAKPNHIALLYSSLAFGVSLAVNAAKPKRRQTTQEVPPNIV
ncbi:uncharacterized protein PADG_11600 [Paracoccidioides brasiliensis Pb18]|uniref:Aquaporin n=1 Tax=Paracoccidioides brasiliensis (strain Pb18) TaxID=502780 RepID=A0A0A0HT69_PARBD|nr:uncharacterized protein PADG_11600 [Paracoccidioides brasiliensis Pb18]KGM92399.1 hypothetical protein PADG_11600 [Paracoccidioides brasiliensis Pb18]